MAHSMEQNKLTETMRMKHQTYWTKTKTTILYMLKGLKENTGKELKEVRKTNYKKEPKQILELKRTKPEMKNSLKKL